MKDTCRMVRTSSTRRDPVGCLVPSEVYEEKVTEESYSHFMKDDEDGNYLG